MHRISPIFLALLLGACATGALDSPGKFLPPEQRAILAAAPNCCSGFGSMQFRSLPLNTETEFSITTQSPAFDFKNSRSFFAAYELAPGTTTLLLKSFPVNMLLNRFGHVFVPAITFLGKDHIPQEIFRIELEAKNPKVVGRSWAEGVISVPSGAKYIVIHDSQEQSSIAWRDSDQPGGYLRVRPGPTGELSIVAR